MSAEVFMDQFKNAHSLNRCSLFVASSYLLSGVSLCLNNRKSEKFEERSWMFQNGDALFTYPWATVPFKFKT